MRDPQAGGYLIDLSLHYNVGFTDSWHPGAGTNDLPELRRGILTLDGVQFDVRGLIEGAESGFGKKYPTTVAEIAVQRACRRVHFLHAAMDTRGIPAYTDYPDYWQIGSYVVHYSDGRQQQFGNEEKSPFTVVWSGRNAWSRPPIGMIRLFKSTWENPDPAVIIRSIDFVTTGPAPARFLVAITAEP